MPLYMDIHTIDGGVGVDAVVKAHIADLQTQGRFDVRYLRYWVNEQYGKVFCLVEAPSAMRHQRFIARPTAWSPSTSSRCKRVPEGRRTRTRFPSHVEFRQPMRVRARSLASSPQWTNDFYVCANQQFEGEAMRRPVLLTLAAVGGVIALLGGTGIYAALSDTARSGTNSIESDALAASSDLQVATAVLDGNNFVSCGSFSDDLVSPLITVPGPQTEPYFYCLRNLGSQAVTVTSLAEEFTDVDVDCTGDEIVYDPASCGFGLGELGTFVSVRHTEVDCIYGQPGPEIRPAMLLSANQTTPQSLGSLAPGQTQCILVMVQPYTTIEQDRQAAQSDRVTWRFAWTGQA